MSRTTTEKNLDNQLWGRRNCANQGDPTVTDAELTVSVKVLDRYTSEENLAKLFYNRGQAESLAGLSAELLTTLPKLSISPVSERCGCDAHNAPTDRYDSSRQDELGSERSVTSSSGSTRCWI